jgi:dihydroorotate dehydrogenase
VFGSGRVVIIGVGGVENGVDAYAKIKAGASLVQIYSAFAYDGPYVVHIIKRDLSRLIKRDGYASIADAVGSDHRPQQADKSHANSAIDMHL